MAETAQQKTLVMDQEDLRRYFGEMLRKEGYISSESMSVFGKLIRLTIEFRDRLKKEKDEILTVEDTRKAVEVYLSILKTGHRPDNLDEKIDKLVDLWLREIGR